MAQHKQIKQKLVSVLNGFIKKHTFKRFTPEMIIKKIIKIIIFIIIYITVKYKIDTI